jgi:FKBP-type peptidyl-prolyl cis-trans isomerase FkpA
MQKRGRPVLRSSVGAACAIVSLLAGRASAADLLTDARAAPGAIQLADGVIYRSVREGSGQSPGATNNVVINYRGRSPRLGEFDSSYRFGKPLEIPLSRALQCWSIGLQRMRVGGKALITCPPATAYGELGSGTGVPPNEPLEFEIELLAVSP